jgi:16S rRNA G966 N2-methylase RsmD
LIRECIEKIGLGDSARVYREHAGDFLRRAARTGMSFDIIFADPPYASDELINILPLIDETDVLKKGGLLMVEHASKGALPPEMPALRLVKKYRYGDTMLTLYRKEPG